MIGWLFATVILLFVIAVPVLSALLTAKSLASGEVTLLQVLSYIGTVCLFVGEKSKDWLNHASQCMRRLSAFAQCLEKSFANWSLKVDRAFSEQADLLPLTQRDDLPIDVARYRGGFPKSIAVGLCCVFIVAAYVIYITPANDGGGNSYVLQNQQPPQETNKAKKSDRADIATKFEDRFVVGPGGCDACGGPELIPLPPRRPHFYPVPRPRPVFPNNGIN
jgi:hypothetical protein